MTLPRAHAADTPVCAIVGAGPGNGLAFAQRFAAAGNRVAMLARDRAKLDALVAQVPGALAITCDASCQSSLERAFAQVHALGSLRTLVYNAGNFVFGDARGTDWDTLETAFRLNCSGCLRATQLALPAMLERGTGEVIVVGATASRRGSAGVLPFAAAKSAQRALAESLARELGPAGIHVAYVVIDGVIDTPHTRAFFEQRAEDFFMRAESIAETVFQLSRQERSAWTFELDLRPFKERW